MQRLVLLLENPTPCVAYVVIRLLQMFVQLPPVSNSPAGSDMATAVADKRLCQTLGKDIELVEGLLKFALFTAVEPPRTDLERVAVLSASVFSTIACDKGSPTCLHNYTDPLLATRA